METAFTFLIYTHAAFGGVALLTGFISILAFKGKNLHKKSGKFFVQTMIISGLTAMLIAISPKHENPVLFAIGIFSTYLALTGYRALRFKQKGVDLKIDKLLASIMLITGLSMLLLPAIINQQINIILSVFGLVGIVLSVQDLVLFKRPETLRKGWLKLHIGKIMGGYISAVTAFIVVNQFIPGMMGWFVPTIIGSVYITYWQIRANQLAKSAINAFFEVEETRAL